jgi:N-acetylmuramoyl-L-alanine amidase
MATGAEIVSIAYAITSSRRRTYALGAHPASSDSDPPSFDCSGLVGWVCGRVNVTLGSWPPYTVTQWNACKQAGSTMTIEAAIATPGALLFNHRTPDGVPVDPPPGLVPGNYHAHIAISRGDGSTIEAMNELAGVGVGNARPLTRWTAGARIPGVDYGGMPASNPGNAGVRTSAIPPFPGEAAPGADGAIVRGWQEAMIACHVIDDTPANHDGVFGDGMTAAINRLQTGFGWSNPDGRGGAHTWTHMHSRSKPPCPRCGA